MNEQDQELMKRYIYQVTKRLSRSQREEISKELEELIQDMYESEGGDLEKVLIQLGNPKEFAKQYQNDSHYLIGPDYYENYILVLKIVMVCTGISAVVSTFFNLDYTSYGLIPLIVNFIVDLVSNLISNVIGGMGIVTLIFAIVEYGQREKNVVNCDDAPLVEKKQHHSSNWNPSSLTPIPVKKAAIRRSDTVTGIIFTMFLCTLLVFAPQVIGVYHKGEDGIIQNIPVFNLQYWSIICPLLLVSLCAGFIDEIIKLVTGCYCRLVLVTNIVTNIVSLVLCTIAFKVLPIWNSSFATEVSAVYGVNFDSSGDLMAYWGTPLISNVILLCIWAFSILEIGITSYKTLRYSNQS